MASINATTSSGIVATADNTGTLQLQTAGTNAINIDASQRAAFVAGTAALPAITTSGDTNTGMFFPAADTIAFAEGGTEAMRIDSGGRVTMPLQPAFYGYRTAGNVSATTTVLHNVVVTNIGSCYNSGTGIFTCPIAGVYEIYAGGHGENSQPTVITIQRNGTIVAEEYSTGALFAVNNVMAIISCAANDQITSVVTLGTFWAGNISGLKMTVKLIG